MKYWRTALLILVAVPVSLALADEFKTINGKEYKNAAVIRVEHDGIVLRTKSGISKIYFVELPRDVRERFGNRDPAEVEAECIAKVAKEWRRNDDENAKERERAGQHATNSAEKHLRQRVQRHESLRKGERAEKQRADKHAQDRASKERNAQAILRKTMEEFQAAEHRAAQSNEDGAKTMLSGQVFIATKGGENVKLGARKVSLIDREAVVILARGLRAFADAKSEQLHFDIAAKQERMAAAQKQIKGAEEDIADTHVEEQEEEQEANAAAEEAEAAWNTATCLEELAKAAAEQAIAEGEQAMAAEEKAEEAERQAEVALQSIIGRPRASDTETAISAAREAAQQAKEDAKRAIQDAQRAREAVEQAREAAERQKQYRLNKASDAADAAREAVRVAWETTDAPKNAADAATKTAGAAKEALNAAKAEIKSLQAEEAYYYSNQFLFSQLPLAIQTAETDAEGKFTMKAPRKGEYVIAAEGWRLMLGGETETYYWLQPISLNGQDQVVQNLSNTNLGGAVGISLLLGTAK